MPLHKALNNF